MTEPERAVITVTELNEYIKSLLDGDAILKKIAVKGEISNFRPNSSGHLYFTLKDEGGAVRCVMFRALAQKLKFTPENGMKVIAVGGVSSFVRDGQYQLYLSALTPDGIGDLYAAFEQLKRRLGAEGLFDPARKKAIPRYPRLIAIVTSPTGAAIQDMLRILKKRYPIARVLVVPVKVQGAGAAEEIAGAITYLNTKRYIDVIITGRGGGSIEDLWCFNEEVVARAIAASRIPVVSAVGHEPDVTISDFAADLRAATPSNAAELVTPDAAELTLRLEERRTALARTMLARFDSARKRLNDIAGKRVFASPLGYFDEKRMMLDYLSERFRTIAEKQLTVQNHRLANAAARLDAMSPLKVLGRGYAIALDDSQTAVRSAETLHPGDRLCVRFAAGSAQCEVQSVDLQS
ncbi:MAG: exodeoxyribonuclease VII large subunit [Clostridiales bacterium]|nr:exodeoxyribonuclease VII large subunit [Clostridiales bacterium]MDD7309369.1 exodeoxyribonuclease VII large subunit [Eubacteriales bacterium]MDY5347233.1 exodeoxyribonuclease VII large subunit [Eubacteriales bacterium]